MFSLRFFLTSKTAPLWLAMFIHGLSLIALIKFSHFHHIQAVASYISYHSHRGLVLLSIRIIAKLSLSVPPSTLVQRCPDSDRILAGFTRIMSSDSADDVVLAEEYAEQITGAVRRSSNPQESLEFQAVRLAALDLVIRDTEGLRPYPNISFSG